MTRQLPVTRGDCVGGSRPCPLVSCRYHLKVDVLRGRLKIQNRSIESLPETCALDVADRGESLTAETLGHLLGLSRQMVDLIVDRALNNLAAIPETFDLLGGWAEAKTSEASEPDTADDMGSFKQDVRHAFDRVVLGGRPDKLNPRTHTKERKAG